MQKNTNKEQNKYYPDFIIVPGVVAFDKNLRPLDLIVYALAYWLEHLKIEKCTASNSFFAKIIGCHPKSVQKSLKNLEKNGYILKVYDEKMKRKEIKCLVTFSFSQQNQKISIVNHQMAVGVPPNGSPLPPNGSQISKSNISKSYKYNNINNKQTNNLSTGLSTDLSTIKCINCKKYFRKKDIVLIIRGGGVCKKCYTS